MVSFQQLRDAKPDLFSEVGERYAKWSERLEQHAIGFGKQVTDRVRPDDVWSGPAAEKAIPHCERLRREVLDNVDEIAGIGKQLRRAGADFAAAKHDLSAALERAETAGLTVGEDGSIDYPAGKKDAALDVKQLIDKAVDAATQADEQIGAALEGYIRKLPPTAEAYVAQQRKAGREAAKKIAEYLEDGRTPPQELLDLVRQSADDEYFSAAFANQLGADGLEHLPALIGQSDMTDEQSKDLMTSLAKTLGTATNGEGPELSPAAKQQLIRDAASGEVVVEDGVTYRKFWAVGKLLDYGEGYLGGDFLADVSAEIYDNRASLRQMAADPIGDEVMISSADSKYSSDPMLVALEAMDHSPEASRYFFNHEAGGELDRLQTLMEEYSRRQHPWEYLPGQEGVLMDAITTATTEFPGGQRVGVEGVQGGNIASHFLHYAAEDSREHGGDLSPTTQDAVSDVLTAYYADLHHRFDAPDVSVEPGAHLGGYPASERYPFSPELVGANISFEDAKELIGAVYADPESRRQLFDAAAVYAEAQMQDQGNTRQALLGSLDSYNADVSAMMDIGDAALTSGAQRQAAALDKLKALADVAGVFGPGGAAAKAVGDTGAAILGQLANEGTKALDPVGRTDDLIDSIHGNMGEDRGDRQARALVAEIVFRHGLWPEDTKTEHYEDPEEKGYWDAENQRMQPPPRGTEARAAFNSWLDSLKRAELLQDALDAAGVE